jgi:hypothetical protein
MRSDTDWGRLFGRPVASEPAPPAVDVPAAPALGPTQQLAALRAMDQAALRAHLEGLLAALQRNGAAVAGELHADGSVAIKSMHAVFLLAEIAASVGRRRLVTLSKVVRTDLESLAGLARLVARSLLAAPAAVA